MKKAVSLLLTLFLALGLCTAAWATEGQDGADSASGPVEVWTGYSGTKVSSHATIKEAVNALSDNKWIVINGDYTLDENFAIPAGVALDVASGATLTVKEGVTLTVAANAKRLAVRDDGTLVNNGTILVCGTDYNNGKVMVQDGGTFDINTLSVPEGYVLDKNGSNYFATEESKALFKVVYKDGTEIKTADISNKTKAKSVTLLGDVSDFAGSFGPTDELADGFVLDLGGHTLSGKQTATSEVLRISVPMTIQNGTIKYMSGNGTGAMMTSADVTIASDVTIDGGIGYGIWTSGYGHTLTVNGTVKSNGAYAITGNGSDDTGYVDDCNITVNDGATIQAPNGIGIYHPEKGTVTINGGTISGHTGVQLCAGKLVVNGGAITSSGENHDATGSQNAIPDGAAISVIDRNYPGGTPSLEINGGTVRATGANALAVKAYDYKDNKVAEWVNAKDHVEISGGTFSTDPAAYVAPGIPVAKVPSDYVVGGKNIADEANSGKDVTVIKSGAITGVKGGVTIKAAVEGVTVNNVTVPTGGAGYTVPRTYYYYPSASTGDNKTTSPKTFDAGMGAYAVSALLSLTGMAWLGGRRTR